MDLIENYIQYVMKKTSEYEKNVTLVNENNEITPELLNRALAEYIPISFAIISEYQRAKSDKFIIERKYNDWYNFKFVEVRKKMIEEIDNSKTIKIAVKEIEAQITVDYNKDYNEWQEKIAEADFRVSFLRRILDQMKKFDSILTNLSNNLRQEIRSFSLQDRINNDPTKNKIRQEIPKRQ
jgi:hypothetical protein